MSKEERHLQTKIRMFEDILLRTIVCLAGVIALKAISASTTYMDDSFRWGGRDGY